MFYSFLNTSGSLYTAGDSDFSRIDTRRAFPVVHFKNSTETVFFMHAIDELLNFFNSFILVCDETLDRKLTHHNFVN
jgi:hypothetical protein